MPVRLLLVVLVSVALGTSACSDDGDGGSPRSTATTAPQQAALRWEVGPVDPQGTAPPDPAVVAAVEGTLDAYLQQAVVVPLRTGKPAAGLEAVLSAAALERVAADPAARSTLLDEGLPPATTSIRAERATAALTSVAGPDGVTAVVGARLDLALRARGPGLEVDIVRQGELTLVQEGDGWRIDSFQLRTQRDSR
ncbi:MAG TPA: hypothetical protein VFV35_02245 [Acidimicrobiales bacterium]|nr:hypothetical protein [Acidimicrobiales bacterium]